MRRRYDGTTLGRQELYAEILDAIEGALWTRAMIDAARVTEVPAMRRVVVGVDPAVTASESSDETGIVVCGLGVDGHGYVLDDRSTKGSPMQWAKQVAAAYGRNKADAVVAEVNQGGDMVETTIRTVDARIRVIKVNASRAKRTRAEPVVSLYEQGRVHHVGVLAALEDQMCTWDPAGKSDSPDRMDGLVHGLTELMIQPQRTSSGGYLPI
jgi:phage terminase large subunit-like protein